MTIEEWRDFSRMNIVEIRETRIGSRQAQPMNHYGRETRIALIRQLRQLRRSRLNRREGIGCDVLADVQDWTGRIDHTSGRATSKVVLGVLNWVGEAT